MDISWSRLKGGAEIGAQVGQTLQAFVPAHPEELCPDRESASLIILLDDPLRPAQAENNYELTAAAKGSAEVPGPISFRHPGASLKVNPLTAIPRSRHAHRTG